MHLWVVMSGMPPYGPGLCVVCRRGIGDDFPDAVTVRRRTGKGFKYRLAHTDCAGGKWEQRTGDVRAWLGPDRVEGGP